MTGLASDVSSITGKPGGKVLFTTPAACATAAQRNAMGAAVWRIQRFISRSPWAKDQRFSCEWQSIAGVTIGVSLRQQVHCAARLARPRAAIPAVVGTVIGSPR